MEVGVIDLFFIGRGGCAGRPGRAGVGGKLEERMGAAFGGDEEGNLGFG